jgi:LmbE family N-acetylglucosaminyl deacetylase
MVKQQQKAQKKHFVLTPAQPKPRGQWYAIAAVITLLLTTILWSILGARVHQNNADQLINPYLFENLHTFKTAQFPGQHTYLLKWPIFLLVHLLGSSNTAYLFMTVLVTTSTLGLFSYILWKIDRRPLVFGTTILMLASVLLLVPVQPYPGGILPVNMAMIPTRNLEYVLYIACLLGVIKNHVKSYKFLISVLGLSVLVASDKLFLSISLVGAVVTFIVYGFRRQFKLLGITLNWLVASAIGGVGGIALIWLIGALHLTHFSNQGSGPYGLIKDLHQLILGAAYALLGLMTNFGANPAFNTTYFREMPKQALHHLFSFSGPALIINFGVLLMGLKAAYHTLVTSLGLNRKDTVEKDKYYYLSIALIWSSIATFGAYIFTNHYYAADSRYLGLSLFALFITLSTYARSKSWPDTLLVKTGLVIFIMLLLSLPMVLKSNHAGVTAGSEFDQRNSLIAQAIAGHKIDYLVGDYWRVVPIRQIAQNTIKISPLESCTKPRSILSSLNWQPKLAKTSFAYVLSLDKGLTDYPSCSLNDIINVYGKPNNSVTIAGTLDKPKELLLFYDYGANHSAPLGTLQQSSATVLPIKLTSTPNTACTTRTILNIVAHEDDDLLFINPDTQNAITAGNCVRTIYVTAGDAGANQFYWLGREQGSKAAYSSMIGSDSIWIERIIKIDSNRYLTIASPRSNPKISLIFMRLPDGNLFGDGFNTSHHKSLQKLYNYSIDDIVSVYGQSTYTATSLVATLVELISLYNPAEVRTLSSYTTNNSNDHSDHMAVSNFADQAYYKYISNINAPVPSIRHYRGYTIYYEPGNIEGDALALKTAAFFKYAKHDGGVCSNIVQCDHNTTYGNYLRRQYLEP